MKQGFHALILAAGKGTRFKSDIIKVLHPLMGRTMIDGVLDSISRLRPDRIHLVVGYQKDRVREALLSRNIDFVEQKKQLGTAHAVMAARSRLRQDPDADLLIMNGDLPLIRTITLRPLLRQHRRQGNALTFMTSVMENPFGFGRIIDLENGHFRIVEEKDATPAQRKLKEANVGIYMFKIRDLLWALPKITNHNKKGEYYLTDTIEILSASGRRVAPCRTESDAEIIGVNDRSELARAVEILRGRKVTTLAQEGVTFYDPASTWVDFDIRIGRDTVIYPMVVLEGKTRIGERCVVYPGAHIMDARIGDSVRILTGSVLEEATVEDGCRVGPYARLRPGTVLREGACVGNFVEMKKTDFGPGSKAMHLSYVGDAEVGAKVNIGAGTITCNYDGVNKSKTRIDSGAFIGSGTQLVAPVKVGKNAYVGAGSTITKDVSPDALAVSRVPQSEKKGWARRKKRKQ
ncbi:MAG: bifunctional UDP-N-acetylglucosamine diphosphorylase/glucosamine-1-phosphate N-acetyltransferase GlmU [Candidatus Aminicenantaceae bacterium]